MESCNPLFARQCGRGCVSRFARKENPYIVATQTIGSSNSLGRGTVFMLNSIPTMLAVGCVLGLLAGLGVGGGSLLILWLSLVVGLEHSEARAINLLFFIPSAIIASIFRWRQGKLDLRTVLPAILSGCISAALFSLLSKQMDTGILKKLFGILLLSTGLKELLYKPKTNKK